MGEDCKSFNQGKPEVDTNDEINEEQARLSRLIPKTERATEHSLNNKVIEQTKPIISESLS